jgi:hypothetical protein
MGVLRVYNPFSDIVDIINKDSKLKWLLGQRARRREHDKKRRENAHLILSPIDFHATCSYCKERYADVTLQALKLKQKGRCLVCGVKWK